MCLICLSARIAVLCSWSDEHALLENTWRSNALSASLTSLQGKSWIVKRSYEDFRVLDKHLHLCIYDRRFSQLSELPRSDALKDSPEVKIRRLLPMNRQDL